MKLLTMFNKKSLFLATAALTTAALQAAEVPAVAHGGIPNATTIKAKSAEEFNLRYEKSMTDTQSFEAMRQNWVKKASDGVVCNTDYQLELMKTFPKGDTAFVKPAKGQVIAFDATGQRAHFAAAGHWKVTSKSSRMVAIDVKTKEILAWRELPTSLTGAIHTTGVTPDGKYSYIAGPNVNAVLGDALKDKVTEMEGTDGVLANTDPSQLASLNILSPSSATLIKIDNETLQPVKIFNLNGRLHHAHKIRNSDLMLFDTFNTVGHSNSVFIMDPATEKVTCAIDQNKLGGKSYTAWSGPEGRYIYIQMEPLMERYKGESSTDSVDIDYSGFMTAFMWRETDLSNLPHFWVARLDLKTGKIDREYPYPGYRSSYVRITNDGKSMFVTPAANDRLTKIDIDTGKVIWSASVGVGPYGMTLNADETEVWVSDKGETASMWGQTVTVVNAKTGRIVRTMPSALQADHIILSPDGKEMWVNSNGEGAVLVFDAKTKKQTHRINMPGRGDPHGLGMVHFPDGNWDSAKLVVDQDEFHNGVDPRAGKPLVY